jgi:hypothetical protein
MKLQRLDNLRMVTHSDREKSKVVEVVKLVGDRF